MFCITPLRKVQNKSFRLSNNLLKMIQILKKYKNNKWVILPITMLMCFIIHEKTIAQSIVSDNETIGLFEQNVEYRLDTEGRASTLFTNIIWRAVGDLRLESVSADGFTAFFSSFNSNPRINQAGYGLGQVSVSFDDAERPSICGRPFLTKIVSKTFGGQDNVGIIGSECVTEGDTVTYSIEPLVSVNINDRIGIDQYKWTIPAGWPIEFFSGDSSSVTFIVGPLSGNDTLRADIGRANFTDTFEYKLPLAQGVAEPVFLQAPPECLPVGVRELVIELDSVAGVSYVWGIPAGWSVTQGIPGMLDASGNVITPGSSRLVLAINDRAEELVLTAFGACNEPLIREFAIERELDASTSITGSGAAADGCVSRPGIYTFSVNAPIQVNWTPPPGWTVDPANSNSATLNITAGPQAQSGYITVQSLACGGMTDSLFISISPDVPSFIVENECLPAGSTTPVTYRVNAVENAVSYTWSLSNPAWGLGQVTTTTPSVEVTPAGPNGSTLFVRANGCASSGQASLSVSFAPETPVIGGDICIPAGGGSQPSFQYTVENPITGTRYLWRVTGGLSITGGQNSSMVTVSATGDVTGDTVEVSAITCDTVTTSRIVTVEGDQGFVFDFTEEGTFPFGALYSVGAPGFNEPGTNYAWTLNGNPIGGTGEAQLISCNDFEGGADTLAVTITNPSICLVASVSQLISKPASCPASASASARIMEGTETAMALQQSSLDLSETVIFPNPVAEVLNVRLPIQADQGVISLTLIDSQGKSLWQGGTAQSETSIDVAHVPPGSYYLLIEGGKKPIVKKLVVQ